MSKATEWSQRAHQLTQDSHIREQAERLMEPLRLIRGVKEAPTYESVVATVAQLVALLELHPEKQMTANNGGIQVIRGPMEGYSVMLHATDVFVMHMDEWTPAMSHWKAGQQARQESNA